MSTHSPFLTNLGSSDQENNVQPQHARSTRPRFPGWRALHCSIGKQPSGDLPEFVPADSAFSHGGQASKANNAWGTHAMLRVRGGDNVENLIISQHIR
jgi:hypothetical protein